MSSIDKKSLYSSGLNNYLIHLENSISYLRHKYAIKTMISYNKQKKIIKEDTHTKTLNNFINEAKKQKIKSIKTRNEKLRNNIFRINTRKNVSEYY